MRWREDKSNYENKYSRNKIRNEVIPILSEINESLGKSILESSKRINKVEEFVDYHLKKFREKYVSHSTNFTEVSKAFLNESNNSLLIYDFLRSY